MFNAGRLDAFAAPGTWLCVGLSIGWAVVGASLYGADDATRPNILWITSEDNAAHWLACYGNEDARTPHLDRLASEGLLFANAFANAPVCSVARSTILSGVHAVTQGTQHMSSRYPIPDKFKPHVSYLRELGYYCSNNAKTDYNRLGDDRSIWDACSSVAHYKNRKPRQPFFAIFNLNVSHASALTPESVAALRAQDAIPPVPRLDVHSLTPPPYLPDLPQVREDIAVYHDIITAMDAEVGELLDELEDFGEADNTIVFYYSDHGGPTPRGKRYLTDTGVRVPLMIRVPEKWQHLSPYARGRPVQQLVSFVDLAPTLLSLAGCRPPEHMQGRAFLGECRKAPQQEPFVFLYADRFDELTGMRRGITDGRYKYIRRFTPHLPAAPCSYSSLWIPSWRQWQTAWRQQLLVGRHRAIWESPQPVEELYDTQADPWEISNLAEDPNHAVLLATMRQRLRTTILATSDTSLVPEAMFAELSGEQPLYDSLRSSHFELERVLELAFMASSRDASKLPELVAALVDADPVVRYWGAMGCLVLGRQASAATDELKRRLLDESSAVRVTAAHALHEIGRVRLAGDALADEYGRRLDGPSQILLNHVTTITNNLDRVPQTWIRETLDREQVNEYVGRFANRLQDIRANHLKNIRW